MILSERIVIRESSIADHAAIDTINETAFSGRAEADLVAALRPAGDVVCEAVADLDSDVVGHILLSRLKSPPDGLALAPVSVRPDRQRRGIGTRLIRWAIDRAVSDNWAAIFVLGDPDYYRRFGFSVEKADRFETDYPKACFMVLDLQPDKLDCLHGKVVYPAAFGNLS